MSGSMNAAEARNAKIGFMDDDGDCKRGKTNVMMARDNLIRRKFFITRTNAKPFPPRVGSNPPMRRPPV